MTRTLTLSMLLTIVLLGLTVLNPGHTGVAQATDGEDEDRWYQIELIVFENKKVLDSTEIWSENPGQPDETHAIVLTPAPQTTLPEPVAAVSTGLAASAPLPVTPAAAADNHQAGPDTIQAYQLLPKDLLTMKDSLERLSSSDDYQPLLHIGWRQRIPERENAQPVVVDSRKLLVHTTSLTTDAEASAGMSDAMPPPSLYEQGPDEIVTEINDNFVKGTLSLSQGRYLHLAMDLLYQRPSNTPQLFSLFGFSNSGNTMERYRMMQQRRLKRDELHYFDHPKFGALVMVTAVDAEDPDQVRTIPLNRQP